MILATMTVATVTISCLAMGSSPFMEKTADLQRSEVMEANDDLFIPA